MDQHSLPLTTEVSGFLVGPPVLKTGETEYLGLAGSIPVHLRHLILRKLRSTCPVSFAASSGQRPRRLGLWLGATQAFLAGSAPSWCDTASFLAGSPERMAG